MRWFRSFRDLWGGIAANEGVRSRVFLSFFPLLSHVRSSSQQSRQKALAMYASFVPRSPQPEAIPHSRPAAFACATILCACRSIGASIMSTPPSALFSPYAPAPVDAASAYWARIDCARSISAGEGANAR